MKKKIIPKEELEKLHIDMKLSTPVIGEMLGVSHTAIRRWLIKYNIPIRNISESLKGRELPLKWREKLRGPRVIIPKEELEKAYIKEKKTINEIANLYKCNWKTVRALMERYGILTLSTSECKSRHYKAPKPTKEELERLYIEEKKTTVEIGDMAGCASATIGQYLRKYDIHIRDSSESQMGKTLSDEHIEKLKQVWQDEDYIKKQMNSRHAKPNKLEKMVNEILQKHFPDEWKYNGDFSCGITIGGMIPDFVNVNGKKQLMEIFGNYWHSGELTKGRWKSTEFGRIAAYSQLGYKCFVFWQSDLKNDAEQFILTQLGVENAR